MSHECTTDYGPLAALIGTWAGDRGMDVAPEPDGDAESPYFETICFEAGGDVTNAEAQVLAIVPYRQVVQRKSSGEVFHHELGYWLWDRASGCVMHSLQIPRAVGLLAGGSASTTTNGVTVLEVRAADGDPDWGILQSPFMRERARTTAFRHRIEIDGDELRYEETTMLEIYGRTATHTDTNALRRVAPPG
jgi:hypothetical protein